MEMIAGVDEVGRGPLAGPVVAAAVILDPLQPIEGLKDSKKLSAHKREMLAPLIEARAIAFAYGRAEVEEIDAINILQATLLAMKRAVEGLSVQPTRVLVDGNQTPRLSCSVEAIIKGDDKVLSISAASILAKVKRDTEMSTVMHNLYPQYGFAAHKGYGTRQHLEALKKHGATPIHRRSFEPIKSMVTTSD